MAPDIAGPAMLPAPQATPKTDRPKAWLLSQEDSDITALPTETTPVIIYS